MKDSAKLIDNSEPESDAGLLYHHSIGSDITSLAENHTGPKCLIYHNVTPPEYFARFRPGFAWLLEVGRSMLSQLADHFPIAVGDSAFNAAELEACGFTKPGVLPIIVDPAKWNIAPDEGLMRRLQDGRKNILFVGRIAPNKKQDRLVEAFERFRTLDPNSRLILAGEGKSSDPYFHYVKETINRLDLSSHVELTGLIDDSQLLAYYRTAHLYWSFSEHEGFGVPLVESMWFEVPVLALDAGAVAETIGSSTEAFSLNEPLPKVALRAFRMTTDSAVRRTVLEEERRRRSDFVPAAVWPILSGVIERLRLEDRMTIAV